MIPSNLQYRTLAPLVVFLLVGCGDTKKEKTCNPKEEIPYDGVDQDCDGADLDDVDGDGYLAIEAGGDDCDDENALVHPGAQELACNAVDEDCDGEVVEEGEFTMEYALGYQINNVRVAWDETNQILHLALAGEAGVFYFTIDSTYGTSALEPVSPASAGGITWVDLDVGESGLAQMVFFSPAESLLYHAWQESDGLWSQNTAEGDWDTLVNSTICLDSFEDAQIGSLAFGGSAGAGGSIYTWFRGVDDAPYTLYSSDDHLFLGYDMDCTESGLAKIAYSHANLESWKTYMYAVSVGKNTSWSDHEEITSTGGSQIFAAAGDSGAPWMIFANDIGNDYMEVAWSSDGDSFSGTKYYESLSAWAGAFNDADMDLRHVGHVAFIEEGDLHYFKKDISSYDDRFGDSDEAWSYASVSVEKDRDPWVVYGNHDRLRVYHACE